MERYATAGTDFNRLVERLVAGPFDADLACARRDRLILRGFDPLAVHGHLRVGGDGNMQDARPRGSRSGRHGWWRHRW